MRNNARNNAGHSFAGEPSKVGWQEAEAGKVAVWQGLEFVWQGTRCRPKPESR